MLPENIHRYQNKYISENVCKDTKNNKAKNVQRTQLKFCKLVAMPMLIYASENWTIIRSDK
jgi:hypothetical protein